MEGEEGTVAGEFGEEGDRRERTGDGVEEPSGTTGEDGSERPEDEDNDASRESIERGDEGWWPSDFEFPRFTLARLF